ncbi:hypothetical protein CSB45_00350 [candidate division KSB3 bacterium]|uniref:Band 7 domain-containing protein n=1 Tax=candidate division KSB3 bacterium TaxID=2044937 RepID=A0A2G6EE98_9BACT|nr:MAG: hypothetical protein CSB45_00350 [candidate division KSB3 bacterium]PIE28393.1 MAG: hypothetical protein CSA57_14200 [candidate division KSB3 bacterium]
MMYFVIAFAAVLVGLLLYFIVNTPIFTVQEQEAVVIERFGKFSRVLGPGIHFMWPLIERKRKFTKDGVETDTVDQRERTVDLPAQTVITRDKVQLDVDSIAYYQIADAERAIYSVDDVIIAVNQLIRTVLRDVIGDTDLEQLLSGREKINERLKNQVARASGDWGISIRRVELQAVTPPASYADAMRRVSEAELTKRAAITEAEGKKAAAILEAEGDAAKIQRVYKAIHDGNPNDELLRIKYLEALEKIADGKATKVFMPFPSNPGGGRAGDFGSSLNQAIGMAAGFDAYSSASKETASPAESKEAAAPADQTTTPIPDADKPKTVRRVVRRVKKKPPSTSE